MSKKMLIDATHPEETRVVVVGGYIADVAVTGSNAFITLQVSADDPQRDDLGERAAKALSTLLTSDDVDGINWIIIQDATGTVIAQEQPAPLN